MEIKITKRTLLKEVNNDMCHNWYYYVQGRIYNDTKTRYRKFAFIVWFDVFDMMDSLDIDAYTKQDIRQYVEKCIFCFTDTIKSYDDCKDFYKLCEESIDHWNNTFCRAA